LSATLLNQPHVGSCGNLPGRNAAVIRRNPLVAVNSKSRIAQRPKDTARQKRILKTPSRKCNALHSNVLRHTQNGVCETTVKAPRNHRRTSACTKIIPYRFDH